MLSLFASDIPLSVLNGEELVESGDGEDVAYLLVDVAQCECASLGLYVLEDTEQNAQSRAAYIFQAITFDDYIFICIFMYRNKGGLTFCCLKCVEPSTEGCRNVVSVDVDFSFHG